MPREKELTKVIPKIYKRNYEDLGMFFFVEAQKQIIPTIKLYQAIENYYRFIGECEVLNIESIEVTLSRMRAEFIDMNYETAKKTKCNIK